MIILIIDRDALLPGNESEVRSEFHEFVEESLRPRIKMSYALAMKRFNEAWRSSNLFETGCGYLVMSRFKSDGRVEAGFFLLDVFCLGVKDAGFCQFSSASDFQEDLLDPLFGEDELVRMTPPAARKLAEGAIAYARGLGFLPAADYKKACRVFGGVSTADCDEEFVFGHDGKPFYIRGPSESPARFEQILRVLKARCGEGGYDYMLPTDDLVGCKEEEEAQHLILGTSENTNSAALEAMAARLRAAEPEVEVRVNPPGLNKVSDMISLVAAPLVESAPDYAAKSALLTFAATAWNYSLLPPAAQEEMSVEIAERFPKPEILDLFAYLVARALTLFPDERRVICKVETDPAPGSDMELRIVSAM